MSEKAAVYAGSFDPPTIGHMWIIQQGLAVFDHLYVAIGVNPDKQYMFTVEERLQMLRESIGPAPNVTVTSFSNQFLINYAKSIGVTNVIRGVRNESDFAAETAMRNINADHNPEIITWFLTPPRAYAEISSSMVKGFVGPEGWEPIVLSYVTRPVFRMLRLRHYEGRNSKRWLELWRRIGAQGDPATVYADLANRYGEPHRAYHNLVHVGHCLDEFEEVRHLAADPEAVEMAIWFHDAVYDPRASDNEEKSATLATKVIQRTEKDSSFAADVAALIMATKHDALPPSHDAGILVDVDLAIFGQPPALYAVYEDLIRRENDWVPFESFVEDRSVVLRSFLERKTIYSTELLRERYEARAVQNLTDALARFTMNCG